MPNTQDYIHQKKKKKKKTSSKSTYSPWRLLSQLPDHSPIHTYELSPKKFENIQFPTLTLFCF